MAALADQGYDLNAPLGDSKAPKGWVLEPSVSGKVEVRVLHQITTKYAGYNTVEPMIRSIFPAGLALDRRAAPPLPA